MSSIIPTPAQSNIQKIAFVSIRDGSTDIFIMNADGSEQTNLTPNSPKDDLFPSWSPDGKRIAFMSNRDGTEGILAGDEIYVMNADGSGLVQLTHNRVPDWKPAWSPDGSQIAFLTIRSNDNYEIYAVNPDGTNEVNLTNHPAGDCCLIVWSPDSKRIAFTSRRSGQDEMYVMNADGSMQSLLTDNEEFDLAQAQSPNGEQVLSKSGNNVYVMNLDGSNRILLTSRIAAGLPTWSPDGKQVLFVALDEGNNYEIYMINPDGTGLTNLTNNPAWDTEPTWQP